LLDHVEVLDVGIQRQLLQTVRMGSLSPMGGEDAAPLMVRFIGIRNAATLPTDRLEIDFSRWLGSVRVELPALRDHLEDLPMLAEVFLRGMGAGKKIEPSAYRALLGYHWPGNLDELRSLLQLVTAISKGRSITERDIVALLKARTAAATDRKSFASEREWILDGLRRNRFRRAETARFLRISRKTLYTKIRQHGISLG
jgi:DNA-binding NtrC family response regulator